MNGWRSSQILKDTEVLASAHTSQDSGSEHPTKVVSKSRIHSFKIHLPKDEIAKSGCQSK